MKHIYLTFLILFIHNLGLANENKLVLVPSATISGTTTVCQNAASPLITFTGSGGTAPYNFTYTINGGANQTISTTGNNSVVTLNAPTGTAGTFTYALVSVSDSQPPNNPVNVTGSAVVTINPQPNANMGGTGSGSTFGGFPTFRICSNTASPFTFTNTSTTTATNTNYTINWGDSTPNFTGTSWTTLTHTYQIGLYYLNYTINGSNGCSITRTFVVFVGSNPAVSLGNPGNTDICNADSLTFPITGTANNPPGTTYTVTFNDGSTPQVFNHPPPSSVTHTFTTSSCNTTSSDGSNSYPNSFSANIVATNPCSTSSVGVVPIYVSANPQAQFTGPTIGCVNTQVCFTNTSIGNQVISNSCLSPSIVWSISPSTGFSLSSGSFGNDFGSTDSSLWLSGSNIICVNFSVAGTYTINIKTGNKCGIDIETKTICIEPPLVPLFSLNTTSGCSPLAIIATNNTSLINQCATPTYLWQVTHTPLYCSSTTVTIPTQSTANASFNFIESGTYAISLTVFNSCTPAQTTTQIVTVKKPPTAAIAAIPNSCGTASINPTATVNSCAPTGSTLTYAWSFPGGTPSSANTANPGTINYPAGGPYTVSLVVSNECGASNTATQNFTVNTAPTITNTSLSQTICSGSSTTLVTLTATPSGTTFSWTATATAGITGFLPSGTNTIPVQTITTTNTSPGTVTYVISPTLGGCIGTPVNYVVNVNPAPSITTQPASSTVCLGGTPTLLSVVLSSSTVTPTYQWYSNTSSANTGGTLIAGATSATYNPPASTVGVLYYYCVITLSSGGCSNITSNVASVTITPLPTLTTQPLASQNLCVGVTIPTPLSVSYLGGIGTATYQWYSNSNNSTSGGTLITGATNATYLPPVYTVSGTYYYYVIVNLSGNGCGAVTSNSAQVTVFDDPTITTQPIATQTLCQGATPSNLVVTASGGNGTFVYQWYSNTSNNTTSGIAIPGANSATYIPLTTTVGTIYYYCIITQSTPGCSVTSNVAAVIINASPTVVNQPVSSTVCTGGTPTTLSLTYTNGIGTPSYQWYSNTVNDTTTGVAISGETNPTFNPPATTVGTMYYYCTITFSGISGSCAVVSTNTAVVTITPGATIDQQPTPNQSLCIGGSLPNPLTVSYTSGTGTASYQWYSNTSSSTSGGTAVGTNSPSYTPPVYTASGTYYYYVVISFSGSGCGSITSTVAQVDVVNDPIIVTQPLASQTLCQNSPATVLSVVASGGIGTSYAYQWYSSIANNTTSGTLLAGETNSSFTPSTTNAGTLYYYCIITQPSGIGCNVTSAIATVIVNLAPAVVNQPQSSIICLGATPTTLSLTFTNGAGTPNYQWYSNTSSANTGGTLITGATSATYNPPAASTGTTFYYCEVTFPAISGSCSLIRTNPAEVTINPNPVIAPETTTICSSTTFTITPTTASGNIIPLGTTYTWSNPTISPAGSITGASAQNTPQTNISQTLVNTTTSPAIVTYTVTPTSGVCVGNNFTVTVTVNPAINPNVVANNNTCFGVNTASITTNITGGIPPYTINWTGPNGFTSAATSITNLLPGVYNVTIDDVGGCPFSNSYTIIEPADIVITVDSESDSTCFGSDNGSINISVTGGTGSYFYTWTRNNNPFATTQDISNLAPGTYVVSVTDVNNCGPKTETFTITEPPLLVVSLVSQTNVLCFGAATGAITVNVVGGTPNPTTLGYTYAWTGPNGFTSASQNLTSLFAGTYNLTVTDNQGCSKNLTVIITQSTEIIIAYTTTPISCYGANDASITTTLSGGNPPYQFEWSNLATSLIQTNLSAGNYTITVTDNLGCQKVQTINIPEAPIFTVNPVVTNITCFGAQNGSINLNLTGGVPPVTLVWSDGSTAGLTRNNLGPGTYTATISDGTPCFIVRTFTIVEPQLLVLSANVVNPLDCTNANSGSINLVVSGGSPPFNYLWSNGATTEDLNNVVAGNYLVTVTDANGCSKVAQYTLTRPAPILITVNTQTDFNCATREVSQSFIAQASGGVPPFQYQWSSGTISGNNNEIMQTDVNGTVILTVTDNLGCQATYTLVVDVPEIGTASFDTSSIGYSTYGIYAIGDPIQFQSTITGDYESVSWDFGDGTFSTELNPVHTYVNPRDYVVTQTVTYPFGCVYTQVITLIVEKGYVLVVPTAFTPNNDSLNDTYRPVTKALRNVKLDIYDTWGSLIYTEKGDVLVGWDGKIRGFNAENGNYYSKVSAETFYGTIVNENQTFVLIK
ncbi:PKD domain-containing protein [Flavobacterium sp. RSB2_4_14]|uniref:PKD domain-containing protein n=1 Tax=Flavobacterium sp. RSB2_4_14 TaxID=3447665 RepID=UPI003F2B3044